MEATPEALFTARLAKEIREGTFLTNIVIHQYTTTCRLQIVTLNEVKYTSEYRQTVKCKLITSPWLINVRLLQPGRLQADDE